MIFNLSEMGVLSDVVLVGIFTVLIYTSDSSFSTIESELFDELDIPYLGELTLFIGYGSTVLWCFAASFFARHLSNKMCLVISAATDMLFFTSCLIMHYTGYHALSIVLF